jgi:hypothetical protein
VNNCDISDVHMTVSCWQFKAGSDDKEGEKPPDVIFRNQ